MKAYGADRTVSSSSQEYKNRQSEVNALKATRLYSSVEMSKTGGGYVAIEKGKAKHKPEEIEAAKHMANAGYKVILKDETGIAATPDGKVFNYDYEQRTPNPNGAKPKRGDEGAQSVKKCLDHGLEKIKKGASVDTVVIYDKYHSYDRHAIEKGIEKFEKHETHRFKQIIVISKSGKVYEHYHNT